MGQFEAGQAINRFVAEQVKQATKELRQVLQSIIDLSQEDIFTDAEECQKTIERFHAICEKGRKLLKAYDKLCHENSPPAKRKP